MDTIKTSLVVSFYNKNPEILKVIENLLFPGLINNLSKEKELIILDDLSFLRNETRELVEKYRKKFEDKCFSFKYIENEKNLGFGGSYSKGMKEASGKYVAIVNSDVYLTEEAIDRMVKVLEEHPNLGAVGPITNSAWSFQKTGVLKEQGIPQAENLSSRLKNLESSIFETNRLIGFCTVYKKEVLEKTEYFDTSYRFGNFEDIDLCFKIKKEGYKMAIVPSVFVLHGDVSGSSASLRQEPLKTLKSVGANFFAFTRKWGFYKALIDVVEGFSGYMGIRSIDSQLKSKVDLDRQDSKGYKINTNRN